MAQTGTTQDHAHKNIRLSNDVIEKIMSLKTHVRETYDDVLRRELKVTQ